MHNVLLFPNFLMSPRLLMQLGTFVIGNLFLVKHDNVLNVPTYKNITFI